MLSTDFSFDAPLVPQPDQWPLFDEIIVAAFSPGSDESSPSPSVTSDPLPAAFPSAAALASMPILPSRSSPRNKNPGHIPRPRNAFMLFRSAFAATQKISTNIEHDNRHITRIIAHCWRRLSDAEKQVWRDKAAAEKAQHAERYPDYRFSPVCRTSKPVKRKVRRNGTNDVKRCETLAELVMSGKYGHELESAIKKFDEEQIAAGHAVAITGQDASINNNDEGKTRLDQDEASLKDSLDVAPQPADIPPFRSPLLPPTKTALQRASDENALPQPLVPITIAPCVEPQSFYFPTHSASIVDGELDSLFAPPPYQYYLPNTCNVPPCPRSIPSPDQYRRIMDFVQNSHAELGQLVPDSTLFSWDQPDSFLYYH